ncbi:UNVERIFIED_CONTAM: hypothetical protein K2H54_072790 [Gekko kuhli]
MGSRGIFLLLGLLLLSAELLVAAGGRRCTLPPAHGPCKEKHIRYYYDRTHKKCLKFEYGGCLGNDNRFKSVKECEDACAKKDTKVCKLVPPATEGVLRDLNLGVQQALTTGGIEPTHPLQTHQGLCRNHQPPFC